MAQSIACFAKMQCLLARLDFMPQFTSALFSSAGASTGYGAQVQAARGRTLYQGRHPQQGSDKLQLLFLLWE
eukprot:scaffold169677_cov22-Tisochrysis_lutea.AAC.1